MSREDNLYATKLLLEELGISYVENYKSSYGITIPIRLKMNPRIALFVSDGEKQTEKAIYEHRDDKGHSFLRSYFIFIIRDNETPDTILVNLAKFIADAPDMLKRKQEGIRKKREGRILNAQNMKRHEEKVAMREQKRKEREERRAKRAAEEEARKAEEQKPKRRRIVITHYEPISHK